MSYPDAMGAWTNPAPPGTLLQDSEASSNTSHDDKIKYKEPSRVSKHHSSRRRRSRSRSKSHSPHRRRQCRSSRSRSSSVERSSRHYSSRRRRERRRYSRSRSRSRSRGRRHRYRHRRYSRSRSRGRSRSHSRSYSRSWSRERDRRCRKSRSHLRDSPDRTSDNEESGPSQENTFKNDGSFLEMFKKMQEQKAAEEAAKPATEISNEIIPKPVLPAFGKRRGGRVLKTGIVQKPKLVTAVAEEEPKDAWSIYMKEVKRYKEACCDDDSKTRPLVK